AAWTVATANGGTITPTGLYTAPASVPNPPSVTITATVPNYPQASMAVTIVSNQPPSVISISANPIPIGVFTFNIAGTGFINGSKATLGGAPLTTAFVSATQLSVTGFASQNAASSIVVSNGPIASQPFAVQVGAVN